MKIYHLFLSKSQIDWESNESHVIVADNEKEAVKLANKVSANEGKIWHTAAVEVLGEYSGDKKSSHIVITNNTGI